MDSNSIAICHSPFAICHLPFASTTGKHKKAKVKLNQIHAHKLDLVDVETNQLIANRDRVLLFTKPQNANIVNSTSITPVNNESLTSSRRQRKYCMNTEDDEVSAGQEK